MPRYNLKYDPAMMPQNLEHVLYEKKEHVAYVTINRPEVRNALHTYAYVELRSCWLDIAHDPDVYVGIVTGAGHAFCAGRDVKFLAEYQAKGIRTPHEDPTSPMYSWGGGGQPKDVQLEKPLISALNGFAVGVGLSIALQCQLRVMADDAWIGDLHTNVGRLGGRTPYMAVPRAIAADLPCATPVSAPSAATAWDRQRRGAEGPAHSCGREACGAMVCAGSPLAVQAAVRLYNLCSAFSPRDVGAGPPSRSGDRGDRGRRRGSARFQGKAHAAVEAALTRRAAPAGCMRAPGEGSRHGAGTCAISGLRNGGLPAGIASQGTGGARTRRTAPRRALAVATLLEVRPRAILSSNLRTGRLVLNRFDAMDRRQLICNRRGQDRAARP